MKLSLIWMKTIIFFSIFFFQIKLKDKIYIYYTTSGRNSIRLALAARLTQFTTRSATKLNNNVSFVTVFIYNESKKHVFRLHLFSEFNS